MLTYFKLDAIGKTTKFPKILSTSKSSRKIILALFFPPLLDVVVEDAYKTMKPYIIMHGIDPSPPVPPLHSSLNHQVLQYQAQDGATCEVINT